MQVLKMEMATLKKFQDMFVDSLVEAVFSSTANELTNIFAALKFLQHTHFQVEHLHIKYYPKD